MVNGAEALFTPVIFSLPETIEYTIGRLIVRGRTVFAVGSNVVKYTKPFSADPEDGMAKAMFGRIVSPFQPDPSVVVNTNVSGSKMF